MLTFSEAQRAVESAALGISGAARTGDQLYARQRRAELGAAAEWLRPHGLDVPTLLTKADRLVNACLQRDAGRAQRLALEINRQLSLLPCA